MALGNFRESLAEKDSVLSGTGFCLGVTDCLEAAVYFGSLLLTRNVR